MSTTELQPREVRVTKSGRLKAIEFLKQNIPPEKMEDFLELLDKINEMISTGEKIDVGELVADLMDPKKFSLPQDIVEEFLKLLVTGESDADKLVAGTIEYAKRKLWRKG